MLVVVLSTGCSVNTDQKKTNHNILFLHHSTGGVIFNGETDPDQGVDVSIPAWFEQYNEDQGVTYSITEQAFPKSEPYGWKNYPYDYYNIWVKHAGNEPYMAEPTLEMLTGDYDVIIFKHCFPVSNIIEETGTADIDSELKTLENYKLQYNALKQKLDEYPETKFIVWTGAALAESNTTPENAERAKTFFNWVKEDWDKPADHIYLWDFYALETEGGLYLKPDYQAGDGDSHPSAEFAATVVPLFAQRIVDVIENNGSKTNLKGEYLNP
jgi:hypothetical protein